MNIDVTFSVAPRINNSFVNFGAQVVNTNLIRSKKFNLKYDYIVPIENKFYENHKREIYEFRKINKKCKTDLFLYFPEFIPNFYKEHIESIDSKYMIVSVANLTGGITYIKNLLEAGKKIIVGGAGINFILAKELRKVLIEDMGVKDTLVNDNMIVIHGHVDLYFDFYKAIKEWKDIIIRNEDVNFPSMYESDYNYLSFFNDETSFIMALLFVGCQWRRCKHCWMSMNNPTYNKNIDLTKQLSTDLMRKYFKRCKDIYPKVNNFFITDNYVSENIIDYLKEVDVSDFDSVILSTGIRELMKKDYVDKLFSLNKKLFLSVGFDFLNEFSLKFINKGYEIKDIFTALDNLHECQQKYNTEVIIKTNRISDSIMDYKWREKEEDENLEKIVKKIKQFGTPVDCRYNQMIFPRSFLDTCKSKYFEIIDDHLDFRTSGAIQSIYHLVGDYSSVTELKYITRPFIRYDENGNIIKARVKNAQQ